MLDYFREEVAVMADKHKDKRKQLGLKIAYYRKLRGLTQEEFSEKAELSMSHISALEAANMDRSVSINTLFDIAEVLEVPAYKFLLFDDEDDNK